MLDTFELIEKEIFALHEQDDPLHFASAAAEALRVHRDRLRRLDPARLLVWALDAPLPPQPWANPFGDPALTVVHNEHFRIDLLYWNHNSTPTHKHVSCGAFAALHGRRLHQVFDFTEQQEITPFVAGGRMVLNERQLMAEGDVHEIHPNLVHDLFWLTRPSVTISVRCNNHPGQTEHPWEFWEPGLTFLNARQHPDADVQRRTAAMTTLRRASEKLFTTAVTDLVREGDPSLVYHVVMDTLASGHRDRWESVICEALSERTDIFGPVLLETVPHLLRKIRLYPVYTGDEHAQLVVSLLWGGASIDDTAAFLEGNVPDADVDEVLESAAQRISGTGASAPELERWAVR
ncbi:hypothetical protein [Lentzea cavernae]|nr:hypothetical protein [Lentzea cavernae]